MKKPFRNMRSTRARRVTTRLGACKAAVRALTEIHGGGPVPFSGYFRKVCCAFAERAARGCFLKGPGSAVARTWEMRGSGQVFLDGASSESAVLWRSGRSELHYCR